MNFIRGLYYFLEGMDVMREVGGDVRVAWGWQGLVDGMGGDI